MLSLPQTCLFPTLTERPPPLPTDRRVEISDTEIAAGLQGLLGKNPSALQSVLQAGWALILRTFCEADSVQFSFKRIAKYHSETYCCACVLAADTSLLELSAGNGLDLHPVSTEQRQQYNTGLTISFLQEGITYCRENGSAHEEACLPVVQTNGHVVGQAEKHSYPIELFAEVVQDSVRLWIKYQDAFLSEKQGHDLASTTGRAILLCLRSTPEDTVGKANMISQRNQADLASWHSGSFPLATGFVHEMVRQRCLTDATAPAVCAWDGELSYAQLDDLSDRVAARLVEKGAVPGVFVPVCFEKSKWAIVASLGVLKAGAAFVPLDPSTPKKRLDNVLRHVETRLAVASSHHASLLTTNEVHCVVLSEATIDQFPKPQMAVSTPLRGTEPAYVLFTSGSTGNPKACVVDHSAFAGVSTHGMGMRMAPNSRVYQFASYAFGMALIEVYCALTIGATVCVPSEEERTGSLAQSMTRMQATWAILTPSAIQSIGHDDLPRLQTLVTAGEPLPRDLMSIWAQRVQLVQGYGLTEWAGICAASEPLSPAASTANIGRLPTSRMWLVDPEDPTRLAPIGAVGEMLLEGPCLAQEYFKQPHETAASFVGVPSWRFEYAAPFPTRLYRSGDLMRYCDDGTCMYIGRKGRQVKIRGQRVELAEVEYHVGKIFPATQKVIAELIVPREDERPRLAVFLLLQSTDRLPGNSCQDDSFLAPPSDAFRANAETVNAALGAVLPRYMIPDFYLPLARVPFTPTGKTSRRHLRQIGSEKTPTELASYIHVRQVALMPTSPRELLLQAIIAQVLKRDPSTISADDSFFHIGGDSIAGMQVSALCRKKGLRISMQDLFRYRTIAALARHVPVVIGEMAGEDVSPAMKTMEQSGDQQLYALSIPQEMLFASCGCLPHQDSQRRVMRLTCLFDENIVRSAVRQLTLRHPMLRARFTRDRNDDGTGKWQQRIVPDALTAFGFLTRHASSTMEIPRIVAEMQSSLHIEHGPVFTAALIYLASEQYITLVGHRLVVDEDSWAILSRDLDIMLQGQSPAMEPQTALSYEGWCQSQQSENRKALLALVQAQGQEEVPRGEKSHRVSQMQLTLDKQVTAALTGDCNEAFRTVPIDIFHAALLVSYMKSFPGAPVPVVLLELSDRQNQAKGASQTVGWLSKIHRVFVDADGEIDLVEAVRRAKDGRLRTTTTNQPRVEIEDRKDESAKPLTVLFRHDPHELYTAGQEGVATLERQLLIEKDIGFHVAACQPLASIDITVSCVQGCVQFTLQYQHQAMASPAVQRWMEQYEHTLRDAVIQLKSTPTGYTLSDIALPSATYGNVQEVLRCSPMQQGILLSQARNPEFYRVQSFWKAHPPNNVPPGALLMRFRTAWNKVVARHAILRTVVVESRVHPGSFDQVVLKEASPRVDGVCLPLGDPISVLRERSRRCDLPTDKPAHHLTICVTAKGVYLGLTISHALIDAQSINIIMRDVGIAYDGNLPPQAPSYGKYIDYIQQMELDRSITYWTQYLGGITPCLLPSLEYRRQAGGELQAPELKSLSLEIEAATRLHQVCSTHGITVSNIFQLAWGLTLRCYTGSDDVCFGYLAAGRDIPLEELDDAVGPYVNMLVCRIQLAGSETVSQLLQKILTDFIDSSSSQHVPLGRILQSLSLSGPLLNTIISMRPPSHEVQQTSSLALQPVWELDPTEFDLAVNVDVSCDSIRTTMNYWSTTCSDEQAANLMSTLHKSIDSILEHPQRKPAQLDLFSDSGYAQLRQLNIQSPERVEECATNLIAPHFRSQPGAVAVCAWDGEFTYAELGCLASQLAAHLVAQGAGPEVFVPIVFNKSRWAVVAILAVMQAGAAFVLLDPCYPVARLREIRRQIHPPMVLCAVEHQETGAELGDRLLTLGDGVAAPWRTSSNKATPRDVSRPSHALYAVFTSGTTGQPKGVVVEHGTFCSSAIAHGTLFALGATSRVLQFSSFAFDVSICEILTTLCFGGCVCVPSEDERLSDLAGAIGRLGANTAHLTASVLRFLTPEQVPSLETVVATGEPMSATDVDQWADRVRLMSAYGPAECCIYSHVQAQIDRQADPRNVGYPTTGLAWLVDPDDHDRLAPLGSAGELVIEGPLVARGYLNGAGRPGEGFVAEPRWRSRFSAARHGAFYKTGDLARYGPKGSLRFIGRKDTQVKINGQRLELADVEYNLQQAVSKVSDRPLDVVVDVVSFGGQTRGPTLAAFLAPRVMAYDCAAASIADLTKDVTALVPSLKAHLYKALPQYMVPRVYIALDHFPLGKTGKTDRRRLREEACKPCPNGDHVEVVADVAASMKRLPRNDAERKIQALVARILGLSLSEVGLDDNFFLLGGESMAAMKLVAAARSEGMMLSVKSVLQQPRLSDLVQDQVQHQELSDAEAVDDGHPCHLLGIESNEEGDSILDAIRSQTVFDGSLIQSVLPTTEFQAETACTWPVTYFLITMHGSLDRRRLRLAAQRLLDRHEILRTVFVRRGPADDVVQTVLQPIPVPFFEFPCESDDLASACEAVCRMDSARGLPLGHLATQFMLFSHSANPEYHILALRLSHAQYDGYCMLLLFRDLARAYGDDDNNTRPSSAVTQYSAYIRQLAQVNKPKARQFWSRTLQSSRGPTRLNDLSLGSPPGSLTRSSLIELTTNIALPTPHGGITVASLMKSAAALILMGLCKTPDVVFCQVVSGRNVPMSGVETIIGVCANIVPVRVRAAPLCTVQRFLGAVQEQHIEALEHETLGLEEIRRYCTEWPSSSPFGCLIQHQSLDLSPEFPLSAEVECTTRVFGGAFERTFLHLVTIPRENQLIVQLFAPPSLLSEAYSQRLLERFCDTALWLAGHPDRMVDEWDASVSLG